MNLHQAPNKMSLSRKLFQKKYLQYIRLSIVRHFFLVLTHTLSQYFKIAQIIHHYLLEIRL